jgi:hypothetical protein
MTTTPTHRRRCDLPAPSRTSVAGAPSRSTPTPPRTVLCPLVPDRRRHKTDGHATGVQLSHQGRGPESSAPASARRGGHLQQADRDHRQRACDEWRPGRRGIRRVTLQLRERFEARAAVPRRAVTQLTKADETAWSDGCHRSTHVAQALPAGSLAGKVAAIVAEHPEGITASGWPPFPVGDVYRA